MTNIQKYTGSADKYIHHLDKEDVVTLANAARATSRLQKNADRDFLLVLTLFDATLRVSEGLALTRQSIQKSDNGYSLVIVNGKGGKLRVAAISASLAQKLLEYADQRDLAPSDRLFNMTPLRAWQILRRAFEATGINKPKGVGSVHILRHSGALARLGQTGNPQALQHQLGHTQAAMTLRYLKTLQQDASLVLNQQTDFWS